MIHGVGGANSGNVAVDSSTALAGPGSAGGLLNQEKDAKAASTDAKFGDIFQNIQNKYGAKPEKPREIKKTLGKDDFLKIMITQMRHQDPTNPFKAEQMAAEMAQFTSVEQLQNVNQNLQKMTTANQPLERLAMTGMIGKTVTVDRTRFPHTEGQGDALSFSLPKDASQVKIAIVSETGDVVSEKDLGPHKAGETEYAWDGLKNGSLPAKAGNYFFRVEAVDENGQSLATNPQKQGRVIGVSFEGNEAVLLVGDANHQDKVTMRNVVRVDDLGAGSPSGGGSPNSAAPAPTSNFFSFQKGVGSAPLGDSLSAEAGAALAKFQQQGRQSSLAEAAAPPAAQVRSAVPGAPQAPTPRPAASLSAGSVIAPPLRPGAAPLPIGLDAGFPNGLHDDDARPTQVSQNPTNPDTLKKGGERP